ncbi:SH3 domain-containing protein [Novosphingobium panipatense]|uniref:SH3 domain-containing protein n=1 Tax=Novosphingobium panipatense TaxID=428991 RepID=UPI00361EC2CB
MKPRQIRYAFLLCACVLGVNAAPATAANEDKVPYWASVDAEVANMRVGPGLVPHRLGVPSAASSREGASQGGPWRLVEDPDGAQGWMRDLLLSRQRAAIVKKGELVDVRAEGRSGAPMLWRVEPGVVGLLGECKDGWCPFDAQGHKGFVREERLWEPVRPD